MRRLTSTENFEKPTFQKFFTHNELCEMAETAVQAEWDFNAAIGDTIKQKYESLFVAISNLTQSLIARGAAGYFWVVTSPELASIFQTVAPAFQFAHPLARFGIDDAGLEGQIPMGFAEVRYEGLIHAKWRLYTDTEFTEKILIGCNDRREAQEHYGVLNVTNLLI